MPTSNPGKAQALVRAKRNPKFVTGRAGTPQKLPRWKKSQEAKWARRSGEVVTYREGEPKPELPKPPTRRKRKPKPAPSNDPETTAEYLRTGRVSGMNVRNRKRRIG